jgi:putative YhdH/YhfP family quinone oxidoreductase
VISINEKKFKALLVTGSTDSKFSRQVVQRSTDELPPGDVLMRVNHFSLNYKDAPSATRNKGVTRKYPHSPRVAAAGIAEESAAQDIKPAYKVIVTGYDLGMNTPCGFGQRIRVPSEWVVKRTVDPSLRESVICGTAGFTAGLSVHKLTAKASPEQGEVLVSGAAGGVGRIALSILVKMGFQVVAVNGKVDAT